MQTDLRNSVELNDFLLSEFNDYNLLDSFDCGNKDLNEYFKKDAVFPAVKITRLGVHIDFQKNNIGSFLLNMVKQLFLLDNRTGCRLITVDAYNNPKVLNFYQKNYFSSFSDKDARQQTRAMFFDLKKHII